MPCSPSLWAHWERLQKMRKSQNISTTNSARLDRGRRQVSCSRYEYSDYLTGENSEKSKQVGNRTGLTLGVGTGASIEAKTSALGTSFCCWLPHRMQTCGLHLKLDVIFLLFFTWPLVETRETLMRGSCMQIFIPQASHLMGATTTYEEYPGWGAARVP